MRKLPWNPDLFRADLKTYPQRGVRHATTFGAWLDGDYVKRFGDPPIDHYAAGMLRWSVPPMRTCGLTLYPSSRFQDQGDDSRGRKVTCRIA